METRKKRPLHWWQGVILLVLTILCILFVGPVLGQRFGLYGTFIQELILLGLAVLMVLISGGDFKKVFPFHRPRISRVAGVVVLWMGVFGVIMIINLFLSMFFWQQMSGVNQNLSNHFTSVPFLVSFLIVAVTPAICEEAVFRGVVFNGFWGSFRNKWLVIILSSAIFGAFHTSVWRFLPTALLGVAMGYILFETGSIFYSMIFHMLNNAFSVIVSYLLNIMMNLEGMNPYSMAETDVASVQLSAASFGLYFMFLGVALFALYIGNHLLHLGQPGHDRGLFPREKRKTLYLLVGISTACAVIGFIIFIIGGLPEFMRTYDEIYNQMLYIYQ